MHYQSVTCRTHFSRTGLLLNLKQIAWGRSPKLPSKFGGSSEDGSQAIDKIMNVRSEIAEFSNLFQSANISKFPLAWCPVQGKKIGFLFNHDQVHQVAHSLPIALSMAKMNIHDDIVIITTNSRLSDEVRRLGGDAIKGCIRLIEIGLSGVSSMIDYTIGKLAPAGRLLIYRNNIELFQSLDVLIVSEKTSLMLKSRYGLENLKIIHTRHGAGDRAIGFDPASAEFDHVLCSGPKIRDRLVSEAGLNSQKITIVGYPKFDLAAESAALPEGFSAQKPTVLYNPHPSPHLSSWYCDGHAILDFFLNHSEYQLIFAPHVMLFERSIVITVDKLRFARPGKIHRKYYGAPNIHIDLGSSASTDMTYTTVADIYLGDVSSQVYEFLRNPRPCLFVNSHQVSWQGDANYKHWQTGPVIKSPDDLSAGLEQAISEHDTTYHKIQKALFQESFDLTTERSSVRAARAISAIVHPLPAPAPSISAEMIAI